LAGLVSALYFDGILENVFASMNLWLPFIFPPIFIGVLRNRGTQISFLAGIAAAVIVLGITRLAGYHDGFFPTILAASANTFALLITSKRSPERNLIRNKIAARIAIFVQEIKATFTTNLPISDILSVFTLLFTVLPIIASAGTGARPARITIALSFALAILAVFFILKDLWFEKIKIKFPSYCLPILVAISQITMPSINVIASEFSALALVNLFIGLALLFILHPGTGGIFWCITGIFTASLVIAFSSPLEFLGDTTSQAMELTFRLLAMVYFVLYFRKQDRSRLERFNSLNGVLAHEVGHSITSMNFCAYRLRATLPILLDLYRNTHTNISNSISNSDLLALEELADRLKENANRTKSTVHIIQNKIHADSTPLEKQEVLVGKLIHEAINSGTKESINPNATIELFGKDFLVTVEIGSMVHVFINLLKNSLEALQNTPAPRINIAIQAKQSSVRITDNGCGVPSDIRHQIFDENFSTKSNGQGKGLHFCKMVLAEFGASITCASRPGKTDFIIQFNHLNEQRGPA
jgi:signal transduction histidine kinase